MALRFTTGFDYYDETQVQRVWPYYQNGHSVAPGRFGGRGWKWDNEAGFLATQIPPASTVIVGMAFSLAYGDPTNPILVLQDCTTSTSSPITQIDIRVTSDAGFQVTRNGAIIGTSLPNLFAFGFWNYMEVKAFINDTTGFVQIRLNGQTYLNITGLDTKYSGNNYVNMVRWQPFASTGAFNYRIDDLYICDDTGTFNNGFLGECRVQTQFPTGNGNRNDFNVIGAANNWQAVSEEIADDDTTYVRNAILGNIDDYVMGTLSLTGAIYGVQVNVTHRKDDVGSRTITPILKVGSNYYEGALFPCQSDYTTAQKLWEKNPDTSAIWTNTSLNASFAGLKIKG